MDIDLSPEIKWINGCCYRINCTSYNASTVPSDECIKMSQERDCCAEETGDLEVNVEKLPNGLHSTKLNIPKIFWGKLIGMKGSTKKRLEEETRCTIYIPRPTENRDVEVTGKTERNVLLACSHIKQIVDSARKNAKYTHFISIPVQDEQVTAKFNEFQRKALELDPNLDEELFTNPARLHLTIVMLLLVDKNEIQKAQHLFQEAVQLLSDKLKGVPLQIKIRGLNTFTDDLKCCNVIYAKIESNLLQEVCDSIARLFYSSGFVKDREITENVKLHLTLLNSKNLNNDENSYQNPRKNFTFDASILLKDLKNFDFGSFTLKSLHLSEMGTEKDKTKYYKSCSTFNLQ